MITYFEVRTKEGITVASEESYQEALKVKIQYPEATIKRTQNNYGYFEDI